jgi:hypothetical protein
LRNALGAAVITDILAIWQTEEFDWRIEEMADRAPDHDVFDRPAG